MVSQGYLLVRNVACQGLFHLVRCVIGFGDQPESVTDAVDVGVDSQCRASEGYGLDDVSSLAADTRQAQQGIHICRYLSVVLFDDDTCHFHQMSGFGVGIGDALDVFIHLVGLDGSH